MRWFRVRLYGLAARPDTSTSRWMQSKTLPVTDTDPSSIPDI